jgi:DNA polymerase V
MFALIDCNNFFVSCERVFQPHLQHKPTLVMSSNDGCVIARSQETKDLGIPMGIPLFKIKDVVKQHNIQLRSTNFKLYRDMSDRVMSVIRSISHDSEVYSIDECFVRIPENVSPFFFCKKIREEVLLQTGIPVSIGVAPTKTLAKLTNKKSKSKRTAHICILNTKDKKKFARVLKETSVGEIWGIGRGFTERLVQKKILDVYQLIKLPDSTIRTLFGIVGVRLVYELRGISVHEFDIQPDAKKSIISSRSFGQKISDKEEIWNSIATHVDHIARELRQAHQVTKCIQVGVYTSRFGDAVNNSKYASHILIKPTNSTVELLKISRDILESIYQPNVPYSKSGVQVSQLLPDEFIFTPMLFEDETVIKDTQIDTIMDIIEKKHGQGSITLGALFSPSQNHKWLPKSRLKSSEYTTSWSDILVIKRNLLIK